MHSTRMRTARSLTVSRISLYPMHAPQSNHAHPPSNHACPPQSNHAHPPPGSNHACPPCDQPHMLPRSNHACPPREQPCMPPGSNHTCPTPQEQPCTPPLEQPHMPPLWTECGHTLLKILPCPNFVAGGKYSVGNGPKGTLPICTKIFSNHGQLFESLSLNHRGF